MAIFNSYVKLPEGIKVNGGFSSAAGASTDPLVRGACRSSGRGFGGRQEEVRVGSTLVNRVGDRIPFFWKSARWIFVPLGMIPEWFQKQKILVSVLFLIGNSSCFWSSPELCQSQAGWTWRHGASFATHCFFSSGNAPDPEAMCTLLASATACDFNFGFMFLLMCEHLWQAYFELFWWMGQVQRSKHTVKVFVDLSRFRRRNRQKHGDRQATF